MDARSPRMRQCVSPSATLSHMTQLIMPQHANSLGITFGGQVLPHRAQGLASIQTKAYQPLARAGSSGALCADAMLAPARSSRAAHVGAVFKTANAAVALEVLWPVELYCRRASVRIRMCAELASACGVQVMRWMEQCAYIAASRVGRGHYLLTGSMDSIAFAQPTHVGDILYITAQVLTLASPGLCQHS